MLIVSTEQEAWGTRFLHRVFLLVDRVYEIADYAFNNNIKMYFEGEIRIDINCFHEGFLSPQNIEAVYSGIGIAMGNAMEKLKSSVEYETKSCAQDGCPQQ